MRSICVLLAFAVVLASCSSGVNVAANAPSPGETLPSVYLTQSSMQGVPYNSATAVDTIGGGPVLALFAVPNVTANLGTAGMVFWGAKDSSSGTIQVVTEAQIYGIGTPPTSVYAYFNNGGLPVLFVDDSSGYAVAVNYGDGTSLTATLCDPSFNAIAHASATATGGIASASDASSGGSCAVSLAASTQRVVAAGVPTNLGNLSSIPAIFNGRGYLAAIGLLLAAILKFKQHKVPPQHMHDALVLAFIAVTFLLFPSVLTTIANAIFGDHAQPPAVNGVLASYHSPPLR